MAIMGSKISLSFLFQHAVKLLWIVFSFAAIISCSASSIQTKSDQESLTQRLGSIFIPGTTTQEETSEFFVVLAKRAQDREYAKPGKGEEFAFLLYRLPARYASLSDSSGFITTSYHSGKVRYVATSYESWKEIIKFFPSKLAEAVDINVRLGYVDALALTLYFDDRGLLSSYQTENIRRFSWDTPKSVPIGIGGAHCTATGVCGSYLRASITLEQAAKEFKTPINQCALYVYGQDGNHDSDRHPPVPGLVWTNLTQYGRLLGFSIDGFDIGGFSAGTFIRIEATPGFHRLRVEIGRRFLDGFPTGTADYQEIEFECLRGGILIYEVSKKSGRVSQTNLDKATRRIARLHLFETWADPDPDRWIGRWNRDFASRQDRSQSKERKIDNASQIDCPRYRMEGGPFWPYDLLCQFGTRPDSYWPVVDHHSR